MSPGAQEVDDPPAEDPELRHAKQVLFRAAMVVLGALIVVLLVFFQPEGQVIRSTWPNGARRAHTTYRSGSRPLDAPPSPDTERAGLTEHGPHRAWHANGRPAEEGRFVEGRREGEWRFWDEAGRLDEARSGVYVRGERR